LPGAVLRARRSSSIQNSQWRFASPALPAWVSHFYVVAALARTLIQDDFRAAELLDLVALGTVGTWCRSTAITAYWWLKGCAAFARPLRARIRHCSRRRAGRVEQITAADLGFAAAPR